MGRLMTDLLLRSFRAIAAGLLATAVLAHASDKLSNERGRALDMLNVVAADIEKNYFDPNLNGVDWGKAKARAKEQIEKAQSSGEMMTALFSLTFQLQDSHTAFLAPGTVSRPYFGFEAKDYNGTVRVYRVKKGGAAEAAGLQVGDRLVAINGFSLNRDNLGNIMLFYRVLQPVGGLELVIQRGNQPPFNLNAQAKVKSVPAVMDLLAGGGAGLWDLVREFENEKELNRWGYNEYPGGIAYLRLPSFSEYNQDYFKSLAKKTQEAKAVVLDLRGNPGGIAENVPYFAGFFESEPAEMVTLVGRKKSEAIKVKPQKDVTNAPLFILTDSDSYSASELFSRHMQLTRRATVVGDRTGGKLTAARVFREKFGTDFVVYYGVYIATSKVVFPGGEVVERKGVVPDVSCVPNENELRSGKDPCLNVALNLARAALKLAPLSEQPRLKELEGEY